MAALLSARPHVRLGVAALLLVAAAGAGGAAMTRSGGDDTGTPLPQVVLGASLQPLVVYERGSDGRLGSSPVLTLHVQGAMIRQGPAAKGWEVTFVAPGEAKPALPAFNGHQLRILFDGSDYVIGLQYQGSAHDEIDFFALVPSEEIARELAASVTNSVVDGPPIGSARS